MGTVCRNCNTVFEKLTDYEKHMETVGWNKQCTNADIKPVFEFIDNKSNRHYSIWENGKVTFKENAIYASHDTEIGIVINRLERYKHKEHKMTREEAIEKIMNEHLTSAYAFKTERGYAEAYVTGLEALGLVKFEEEEKISRLFEINATNVHWDGSKLYPNGLSKFNNRYGTVRLEEWPEGLVLWVGGEIVYKSWEKTAKLGSRVTINTGSYAGEISRIW